MANAERIENWDLDDAPDAPAEPERSLSVDAGSEFSEVGGPVGAMHQRLATELGIESAAEPAWHYKLTVPETALRHTSRISGIVALGLGFVGTTALLLS